MSKVTKKIHKEEKKDDLNEPLVIIEQDSPLTKKRIITYPFNKEKKESVFEEVAVKSNKTGPGEYNILQLKKISQTVVSKESRLPNYDNRNPGVGEYQVEESNLKIEMAAPKYGIPKAERKNPFEVSKEKRNIPGTGSYNLSLRNKKKFYIEQRIERFHTIENNKIGVGEYNINDAEIKLKKKSPAVSAVKSQRKDPFEVSKDTRGIPGIGSYNINKKEKKGIYIEGKKQRFETSYNDRPGVGEYNINDAEIKLKKKSGGISTSKSARKDPFEVDKDIKNIPGAGAYNTIEHSNNKFYIETSIPRFATSDNGKPGVGDYDINEPALKLKKKTGISSNKAKRKDPFEVNKESKNVPGIGTYDINKKSQRGVYIEKTIQRFVTWVNDKPGVGEYNINDAELKLKKKTGISTSKSARKDPFEVGKESKNVPGIGTYNINKKEIKGVYIEGKKQRFETSSNERPGVGEYDINEPALKLKKKTGISTFKSKRKDPFEVGKDKRNIPGAGTYNTIRNHSHKFYIEGNVPRFSTSYNGKPGVGEYDINEPALKLKKKTGISTSKSARKDPFEVDKETKNVPGAGTYNTIEHKHNNFYINNTLPRFATSGNDRPGVG